MSAIEPPIGQKTARVGDLPPPSAEAQAHSARLLEHIHQMIVAEGGRISFETYMNTALFQPQLGYYRCGSKKFGAGGDFITAPEVSPLFAQCLARFKTRIDAENTILEVGAGTGRLAAGILEWLKQHNQLPDTYYILELSHELRQRQRQTIQALLPQLLDKVIWLDDIPEQYSGLVIANELLDAMPVRRFRIKHKKLYEQFVSWHDGVLCYEDMATDEPRLQNRVEAITKECELESVANYLSEINFMAEDWLNTLGQKLQSAVVLIIDYGYPRNAYYHRQRLTGTLMCHYQHRAHPDPLILPGIQDITAHIDFTAMADTALAADMDVAGFTTQGYFLMNMGVLDALDQQQHQTSEYIMLANEIKRLTLPGEMGEQFKVLSLSKNYDATIPGFEMHDLRHLL